MENIFEGIVEESRKELIPIFSLLSKLSVRAGEAGFAMGDNSKVALYGDSPELKKEREALLSDIESMLFEFGDILSILSSRVETIHDHLRELEADKKAA